MNMLLLPKSHAYIKSIESDSRKGHHVHVASRMMMKLRKPFSEMAAPQQKRFDTKLLKALKQLDEAGV